MPEAISRVVGLVMVERRSFLLFGAEVIDRPVATDEAREWIPWDPDEGALDKIAVASARADHRARFTMAAWESAPGLANSEWETVREMRVLVGNNGVEVSRLTGGLTGERLDIPAGTYWLRACCRGRNEIAGILDEQSWNEDDEELEWVEGIEVYQFDFWRG